MTGAGALDAQGHTVDPAHGQTSDAAGPITTLRGMPVEGPAGPDGIGILEGTWGLSGGVDLDGTPRSHAAPVPGWAGSYSDPDLYVMHENSADIHSADFGALTRHTNVNTGPAQEFDRWTSNDRGENVLQPLDGQIRAMGHGDVDQGYGFVNGNGFGAGHRDRITAVGSQPMAYLDPAERAYIVPQASGTFTPTDAVSGPDPVGTFNDGASINSTPPTSYTPPPDAATAAAPPIGAPASAGWGW